jgi:glycosyltransferase involved in cell wall biosynthesis
MVAYESDKQRKLWTKFFQLAKNVDVLNPVNSFQHVKSRLFISPTSFPYLKETFQIPEEQFTNEQRTDTIVFSGSFLPQKNPLFAIEGFNEFLKCTKRENAQFILIGKGQLLTEIEEKAKRINQQYGKEVIRVAPESELINILATSKIFLSLQDFTNYPSQSLMEGMLFGLSVISFNNGETTMLVDPAKKNILLENKNPVELGHSIEELLRHWTINIENRKHILEKFTPGIFTRYFFNIHEQIINS